MHSTRISLTSAVAGVATAIAVAILPAGAAVGEPPYEPPYVLGESDAESIPVFSGLYDVSGGPGTPFWWDHTDLTVAVSVAKNRDPELVQAIRDGIADWREILATKLPTVTLTDVSGQTNGLATADIVIHYVPGAGGNRWGGTANGGYQQMSIVLKSELSKHAEEQHNQADFDALRVRRMTLHELGHALGIGHPPNRDASVDVMGYGWALPEPDLVPVVSDCDIAGIAAAFSWAVNGEEPHPATVSSVTC